eukprot:2077703-Rhodomonas_salina.3
MQGGVCMKSSNRLRGITRREANQRTPSPPDCNTENGIRLPHDSRPQRAMYAITSDGSTATHGSIIYRNSLHNWEQHP